MYTILFLLFINQSRLYLACHWQPDTFIRWNEKTEEDTGYNMQHWKL
jgi:hypothetical protein